MCWYSSIRICACFRICLPECLLCVYLTVLVFFRSAKREHKAYTTKLNNMIKAKFMTQEPSRAREKRNSTEKIHSLRGTGLVMLNVCGRELSSVQSSANNTLFLKKPEYPVSRGCEICISRQGSVCLRR